MGLFINDGVSFRLSLGFVQIIYLLKVYVNMIHEYFYQLDIESLENYTSMIIHVGVILFSTNKLGWDV